MRARNVIGVAYVALTAKLCSVSQDQSNYLRIFNPEREFKDILDDD
jgi:hypothetical protein